MWEGGKGNGGKDYLLECSLLNAYVLHGLAFPDLHQCKGRSKVDFLTFRMEVATQLIGGFCSRKRACYSRSSEYTDRLNVQLGHWPTKVVNKRDCVVCLAKQNKLHLLRSEVRHQTRNKCSVCNVYLCIEQERDCFAKYHKNIEYWL